MHVTKFTLHLNCSHKSKDRRHKLTKNLKVKIAHNVVILATQRSQVLFNTTLKRLFSE